MRIIGFVLLYLVASFFLAWLIGSILKRIGKNYPRPD